MPRRPRGGSAHLPGARAGGTSRSHGCPGGAKTQPAGCRFGRRMSAAAPVLDKPSAIRSSSLKVVAAAAAPPRSAPGLLEALLREQKTMTAVEQFSFVHETQTDPHQAR